MEIKEMKDTALANEELDNNGNLVGDRGPMRLSMEERKVVKT